MPPRSLPRSDSIMLDTWGRANRTLTDRQCPQCARTFRPLRASSKYCSRPCATANNGGHNKKDETWWINGRGYVEGRIWENGKRRRVRRHRYLVEKLTGSALCPTDDVHHINGDKTDNSPGNLEAIPHGEHSRLHSRARTYKRGYRLNLSDAERKARSERMRQMRRAAIARATGK